MAGALLEALLWVLGSLLELALRPFLRPLGPLITRHPRLGKAIAVMFSLLVLGLLVTMLVWAIAPDQDADAYTPPRFVSDG